MTLGVRTSSTTGVKEIVSSTANTAVLTRPGGAAWQTGDLWLVFAHLNGDPVATMPAGFTSLGAAAGFTLGQQSRTFAWLHSATAGEAAPVISGIANYRGYVTITAIQDCAGMAAGTYAASYSTAPQTTQTMPTVTVPVGGGLVVRGITVDNPLSTPLVAPSGYAPLLYNLAQTGSGVAYICAAMGLKTAVAGATGTEAYTSAASNTWGGLSFVLIPSVPPVGGGGAPLSGMGTKTRVSGAWVLDGQWRRVSGAWQGQEI